MGTWGAGNLESDTAAEYLLYEIMQPLETQILSVLEDTANAEADEDGDCTVVAVDALAALCAHFGETTRIKKKKLGEVQHKFMKVWSKSMDDLEPVAGHKEARQAQIEAAFTRLLEHAR
jgi:predicted ATPase with chaperone activity